MKIWIITLFPEYFEPFMKVGVIGQLLQGKRGAGPEVHLVQLRDFATNKYKSVDDYPYGGGPGMVMRADILREALIQGVGRNGGYGDDPQVIKSKLHVISTSARGILWTSQQAKKFSHRLMAPQGAPQEEAPATTKDLVFICGRYEGMDERFIEAYVDEEICVGDYILSGGEIAVMAILDSAFRYLPGALGNEVGPYQDSFEDFLLESPQFTRPPLFEDKPVPEILLSGHHEKIETYRSQERMRLTRLHRPDLLKVKARNEGDVTHVQ